MTLNTGQHLDGLNMRFIECDALPQGVFHLDSTRC